MKSKTHEVSRQQLVEEFNSVVADTETLLKSVATASGEKAGDLRARVEERLSRAKARLRDLQHAASSTTRAAAHATDDYVHQHPWQAIGLAAGAAAVLALVVLLSSRRHDD